MSITVWQLPQCPACDRTKKLLDKTAVPYTVRDLTDPDNAAQLARFKAQGFMTAPIVQSPAGIFTGLRPDKIVEAAAHVRSQMTTTTAGPDTATPGLT